MWDAVNVVRNHFCKTEAYNLQEEKMVKIINEFVSTLSMEQYRLYLKAWYEICEFRKIEVDEHIKVANKLFVDMFK